VLVAHQITSTSVTAFFPQCLRGKYTHISHRYTKFRCIDILESIMASAKTRGEALEANKLPGWRLQVELPQLRSMVTPA